MVYRPPPGRGGQAPSSFARGRLPARLAVADSDEESDDEPGNEPSRRPLASLADAVCPLVTGGGHMLGMRASEFSDDEIVEEGELADPLRSAPGTFTSLADIVGPLVNHRAAGDLRAAMAVKMRMSNSSEEDLGVQLEVEDPPSESETASPAQALSAESGLDPVRALPLASTQPVISPLDPFAPSSPGPKTVAEAVVRTKVNALRSYRERMTAHDEEAERLAQVEDPSTPAALSSGTSALHGSAGMEACSPMHCSQADNESHASEDGSYDDLPGLSVVQSDAAVSSSAAARKLIPPLATRQADVSLNSPSSQHPPLSSRSNMLETPRSQAESSNRGVSEVEWRDVSEDEDESDAASSD